MRLILFIVMHLNILTYGQTIIHHQALSSQGTGVNLSNGVYVNQTIGQQNVIGNYSKNGHIYGQGFQQGNRKKDTKKNIFPINTTICYPNPFIKSINFQFSKSIEELITVTVSDMQGKFVFQQKKSAIGNVLTIELGNLSSGDYIIKLTALNYNYFAKILKQPF